MVGSKRTARKVWVLSAAICGITSGILNPKLPQAKATTYYWDDGSDVFSNPSDWTTDPTGSTYQNPNNSIPGSGDTAVFNGSSDNQNEIISLNASESIGSLIFQNTGTTQIESSNSTTQTLTIGSGGITINSGAGAVTLGDPNYYYPLTVTLGAAQTWTNNSSNQFTVGDALSLGGNLTIAAGGSYTSSSMNNPGTVLDGLITGSGNLALSSGMLVLQSNANTYTGTTTITGGALSVSSVVVNGGGSGLGNATSAVALSGGGILSYTGTSATYSRGFTIGSGGGEVDVTNGGQTLTSNTTLSLANGSFIVGGSGNLTISTGATTALSGTNNLVSNTTGTFEISTTTVDNISGAMPIYIEQGTFLTNISTKETTLTNPVGTGTITMTPTYSTTYMKFSMGSGTYTFPNNYVITNNPGYVQLWNFSGLVTYSGSITGGGSNTPTLELNNNNNTAGSYSTFTGGISGQMNVQFDGYGNGSPINVTTAAINNAGTITNVGTNASGLVTISSTIGSNVTGVIQNGFAAMVLAGNNNLNPSLPVTIQAGSLEFYNTQSMPSYPSPAVNQITVAPSASLILGYGGSGQFTYADLANVINGTLPVTVSSGGSIGVDTSSGSTTIPIALTNFTGGPSAGNALGFSKAGTNVLFLTGANTYTGPTNILEGILVATPGVGLPSNTVLNIDDEVSTTAASYAPPAGTFTWPLGTSPGNVEISGATSGFTALNGPTTINLGGAGAQVQLGSSTFNPTTFLLNDAPATGAITFANAINLGSAAQGIAVNSSNYFPAVLSGALTDNGGGGISKSGTGTLYVTNPGNTYTGVTNVTAGTLVLQGAGTLSPSTSAIGISSTGTLKILNDGSGSNGTINQGTQVNLLTNTSTAPYATLYVGPNTSNNTGNTVAFGLLNNLYNSASNGYMVFLGSNGYNVSFSGVAMSNSTGDNTELIPLTASVIINGNVTNSGTGSSGNYDTLYFSGYATGNQILGSISDAPGENVTTGNYSRLYVQNANTVTLAPSSSNVYTGGTFVGNNSTFNTGVLVVNGSIGGSLVTVQGGGTLEGTGTIGNGYASLQATQGTVVVDGGAGTSTQGTLYQTVPTGTLTIQGNGFGSPAASLTLGSTTAGAYSVVDLATNGSSIGTITLSGGNSNNLLVNTGGAVINILPTSSGVNLAPGTYTLMNFASASGTSNLTLGSVPLPAGEVASLSSTGTSEQLVVSSGTTAGAVNAYWTGSQSNAWNAGQGTTSTNFTNAYSGGSAIAVPDLSTNVFFPASSASTQTSSLGRGFAVNSLSFTPSSTASTIGGPAPLTIYASSGFTDQNGSNYPAGTGIVVQSGVTANTTLSTPIVLGNSQTWTNNGTGGMTFSGLISGTGPLTFNITNTSNTAAHTFSSALNFTGPFTYNSSGSGTTTLSGGIGPNVTAVIDNGSVTGSNASAMTISGALWVNSGGTTLINNSVSSTSSFTGLTVSGAIDGVGNLTLQANTSSNIYISGAVNIVGTITNSGTGVTGTSITNAHTSVAQLALADIYGALGASNAAGYVTGVYQNSPTSDLVLSGNNSSYTNGITINAGELDIGNYGSGTCAALGGPADVVLLGTGSANATLNYNARVADVGGASESGQSATVAGQIVVGGTGLDVIQTSDYVPTFTGQVILKNNLTIALPNSGGGGVVFTGGIVGTGNITVSSESTGGSSSYPNIAQFTTLPVNNSGTITYNNSSVNGGPAGTGANAFTNVITGGVGSNVTGIIQNSYNPLTISTAPLIVNANGTTLTQAGVADTAGALPLFTVSGGVVGTGNLILNNNSTAAGLTLTTITVNNVGTITNSGTGAAGTTITAAIGSYVTGVIQNSSTSSLTLSGNNLYSGGTNITAGTLLANTPSGGSSTGSGPVTVGASGILGGTGYITGANAVVSVTGAITAGNGATSSSTQGHLTTTGGSSGAGATTASQIWNATGTYDWKYTSATPNATPTSGSTDPGGAGSNWDMLTMTSLSVQSTSSSPFVINPVALNGAALTTSSNPYTLADITSGNVTIGSGTANYSSNAAGLANALQNLVMVAPSYSSQGYKISAIPDGNSGDDIVVVYAAAPEPTSLALATLAAGSLVLRRRRRRAE